MNQQGFKIFSSIHLSEVKIFGKQASAQVQLYSNTKPPLRFKLQLRYEEELCESDIGLLRLAFFMPLINYSLFTEQFVLDFPVSRSDHYLLTQLNEVFSKDIYVNKILRRRTKHIFSEYVFHEGEALSPECIPHAPIQCKHIMPDEDVSKSLDANRCGVLSSGGKESLLTYGLLQELGALVYPCYINESGGHWRTAVTAYNYHHLEEPLTKRVWTNVDRFYTFMLDHLAFIRPDHRSIRADTYPIRLCIFPFYIFSLLPIFLKEQVGNILLGSEFDDQREPQQYQGIHHYFGVYDQHQDFDDLMNAWYAHRIPSMTQWSAVRNISGLIVERILVKRYPSLALLQRSCHSCHIDKKDIVPCGHCSKCLGVILFLLANHERPEIMNFQKQDVQQFFDRIQKTSLRLDVDEQEYALLLAKTPDEKFNSASTIQHVNGIHVYPAYCDPLHIPASFRLPLYKIFEHYTKGYYTLKDKQWVEIPKTKVFTL